MAKQGYEMPILSNHYDFMGVGSKRVKKRQFLPAYVQVMDLAVISLQLMKKETLDGITISD